MKPQPFLILLILVGCAKDPNGTPDTKSFKDSRDSHTYKYVKIGTQTWMAENLAYLPGVSPSSEGSESSAFYYVYGYEGTSLSTAKANTNCTTYGVLYNWEAAKIACPSGWHLPTKAEWSTLEDYLGALAGKKMKSISGWSENGNGDNSSGFNALPGGYRTYDGSFGFLGDYTDFWSSSEFRKSDANDMDLNYNHDDVYLTYDYRSYGFSVRCLQN